MQSCPAEIWELIIEKIPAGYPKSKLIRRIPGMPSYIALGSACRSLAELTRPHIFNSIFINSEERGQELLDLMRSNPDISRWSTTLCLQAKRMLPEESLRRNRLADWLGGPEGTSFISRLPNVRKLCIEHFPSSTLKKVFDRQLFSEAWSTLRSLRSVAHLDLRFTELPSVELASELLTTFYPHMRELSLFVVKVVPSSGPSESFRRDVRELHLTNLKIHSLSVHMGVEDHILLRYLHFPSLTSLHVSNISDFDNGSFLYVQYLLDHSPQLEKIILSSCFWVEDWSHGTLHLGRNPKISHIAFEDITGSCDLLWFSSLLQSLPNIENLRCLEFSGQLDLVSNDAWLALGQDLPCSQMASFSQAYLEKCTLRLHNVLEDDLDDLGSIYSSEIPQCFAILNQTKVKDVFDIRVGCDMDLR